MPATKATKNKFLKETEELRSLQALEAIEGDSNISQRELAERLGVALGIANACVHALVRKGMVKIRGQNNRSISYHLTKKGLLHKTRLAMEWTRNTVDFYRLARQRVALELAQLAAEGIRDVILYGANEVTEIAVLVAPSAGLAVKGIIRASDSYVGDELLGIPVGELEDIIGGARPDAVVTCAEPDESDRGRILKVLGGPGQESKIHGLTNRVF